MTASLKRFTFIFAALYLLGALFPWFCMYQGAVFGFSVSLRALGDVGGLIVIVSGLSCFCFVSVRNRLLAVARDIDDSDKILKRRLLLGFAVLYFLIVVSHKLRAQALISTHAYDLGFFSNICWNTAHGNWFFSSEMERNFMSVHVNWILWPLSLPYKFGADARTLLIAQAAFVSAAVPILWTLIRNITGSFAAGGLGALLFVCSPYINHSVSNDFHPDLWMLPCLFASILSWQKNKPRPTVVWALLAILGKEDISVVVCAWGVLLFFKRWRWTGAFITAASLAIFLYHTRVFIPTFLGGAKQSLLFYRYAFMGQSYADFNLYLFLKAIVFHSDKYMRLACYLLPVAGLTCFAPSFLFPPMISVLPHILSQSLMQLDLADIYAMPSQPFLFTGAAFGSVWLLKRVGTSHRGRLVSALIVVAGVGLLRSPTYFQSKNLNRLSAFREMKSLIPQDASLLAQQCLFPQFDTRRFIQIFPIGDSFVTLKTAYLMNPEFVVCDRIGNALPFDGAFLANAIAAWETDPRYEKIFEKDDFIVFKRRHEEPLQWRQSRRATS